MRALITSRECRQPIVRPAHHFRRFHLASKRPGPGQQQKQQQRLEDAAYEQAGCKSVP